jgi:hypothetical protein
MGCEPCTCSSRKELRKVCPALVSSTSRQLSRRFCRFYGTRIQVAGRSLKSIGNDEPISVEFMTAYSPRPGEYSMKAERTMASSERPIASGRKLLAKTAAMRNDCRPFLRDSAQSPLRFDGATSRLGLPFPRDTGLCYQALVSGLQRLEVGPIICLPLREPVDCLPQRQRLLGEAGPKCAGLPYRVDRQLPI